MEEALVSVIVPIYNVELYLKRCIDSIINQTYKNIEIILVNDGSKDGSYDICKQYLSIDKRIKVISQENRGLSAARNTGLNNSNGKFICFIDSDDYINNKYIETLMKNMLLNDADISACDFYYVNGNGEKWQRKEKNDNIYSNIEAMKDIFSKNQNTEVIACNKIYKKSLFAENNIRFPEGRINEDNFTTYKLYYYSKKIVFTADKLYYYFQRKNSIMKSQFNLNRADALIAIEETKKFITEHNLHLDDEIDIYEFCININLINNSIRNNCINNKKFFDILNNLKSKKKKLYENKNLSIKEKLVLFLLCKNKNLYIKLYKTNYFIKQKFFKKRYHL